MQTLEKRINNLDDDFYLTWAIILLCVFAVLWFCFGIYQTKKSPVLDQADRIIADASGPALRQAEAEALK